MIVYRQWDTYVEIEKGGLWTLTHTCDGWFLFGFVPIYLRQRFPA